jgi:1,2-diacylglycerol-3-alpha-glucose alpha-1,2-glucosyltransferase
MKISHYFEFEDSITGGISSSVKHQRKILERRDIDFNEEPDLESDILDINVPGPRSIFYALRAKRKGIPIVMHTHLTAEEWEGGSFRFTNFLSTPFKYYLKYTYSLADHLICPSDYNKHLMEDYSSTSKTVISNGVDKEKLEGFEELREEYLEKYNLEPPVVFCVGLVLKRKGLKAFIETAREMPELDFVWFGYLHENLKTRETKNLIESSPENCQFTGYIDDIRGGFAAGDIFFFPTKEENEGISLLEALSCGKPVLIRDIEIYDWLEDGKNCLKADDGDFDEKLEKLKDPDLRDEIGQEALEKSKEFELDKIGDELVSVYKDLI